MANIKFTAREEPFIRSLNKMSGAVGTLAGTINTKLVRSYQDADKLQRQLDRGLGRWADGIKATGTALTFGLTAPLLAMGGASLKAFGDVEALRMGLEAIEGSAEAAGNSFERIRELAKLPGLGFYQAAQGYTNLRALGFGAEFAEKTLSNLGNALALGGKGKMEFTNVINQFTQMSSKSKVMMEDLKPILNAAPTIATAVKKLYGTISAGEISKDLNSQGKTPVDFVADLVEELGKLPKAGTGVKNSLENLQDNLKMTAAGFGEIIDKSANAKGIIDGFGEATLAASDYLKGLSPATQDVVVALAGLAVAIGPVMVGVGFLVKAGLPLLTTGFGALLNPIVLVTAAVAALGLVYFQHTQKVKELAEATRTVTEIETAAYASRDTQMVQVKLLTRALNDENTSHEDKKKALDELKGISPQYFGNLDIEKIKTDDVNLAVRDYADSLYYLAKMKELTTQKMNITNLIGQLIEDPEGQLTWLEKLQNLSAGIASGGIISSEGLNKNLANDKLIALSNTLKSVNEQMDALSRKMLSLGVSSGVSSGGPTDPDPDPDPDPVAGPDLSPQNIGIEGINRRAATVRIIKELSYAELQAMDLAQEAFEDGIAAMNKAKEAAILASLNNNLNSIGIDFIGDTFESLFSSEGMEKGMKTMLHSLGSALQQVAKQFLMAEYAIKFMKATFGAGPWGALAAIAAGGVIKGLANNIKVPALAQGGITMGPQLALIGDNASGKEAVIPFERMPEFLNMVNSKSGGNVFISDSVIKGQDIVTSYNRAKSNN
jgi:tape measure domain-containing protein